MAGPILAALLVLGLLAGGGWYLTRDGRSTPTSQDEPLTVATDDLSTPPAETPTPTPSVTPSATPKPSVTPSRTPSRTPRATPTPTRSTTAPSRGASRTPKPSTTPSPKPSHTSTPKPTKTTTAPPPSGGPMETQVLQLTNAERQKAGCGPLKSNSALTRAAEAHAADMVDNHYFDHTSQDGRSPFDRMKAAGFRGGAMAENIAVGYSSAAAVVEGWMNSEGHRKNMLNCDYTMLGVGYDSGQVKPDWGNGSWVQNFGA
ncbi:CAP domain-containing protein [Kribbella sp. CA-253562]|uniref:CAP domain-containing protein n=1 Tax=Kribbella sp. CA-253562 TaxID=3239942 RepID=UPI003D89C362